MNKQTFYTIEVLSNITEYVGHRDTLHKLPDYAIHFDETEASETLNRIAEKYPTCKVVAVPVEEEQTDEQPENDTMQPILYKQGGKVICYIKQHQDKYHVRTGKPSDATCIGWTYDNLDEAKKTAQEYFNNRTNFLKN